MRPYFPALQDHAFSRTPDWRWRRASWLVANGQYFSRRRDDAVTGQAVYYLREEARRNSPGKGRPRHFPDIHAARRLHEGGGAVPLVVQARLLARQSSAEIARRTGLPLPVVDAYEAVFFHCRDRLDARDWVLVHAVGRRMSVPRPRDPGVILKSFAYLGGPPVLEAVLPYLVGGQDLFAPPLDLSTPAGRREQAVRLAVAAEALPQDPRTDKKLLRILPIMRQRVHYEPVWLPLVALMASEIHFRLENPHSGAPDEHQLGRENVLHPHSEAAERQVG